MAVAHAAHQIVYHLLERLDFGGQVQIVVLKSVQCAVQDILDHRFQHGQFGPGLSR